MSEFSCAKAALVGIGLTKPITALAPLAYNAARAIKIITFSNLWETKYDSDGNEIKGYSFCRRLLDIVNDIALIAMSVFDYLVDIYLGLKMAFTSLLANDKNDLAMAALPLNMVELTKAEKIAGSFLGINMGKIFNSSTTLQAIFTPTFTFTSRAEIVMN